MGGYNGYRRFTTKDLQSLLCSHPGDFLRGCFINWLIAIDLVLGAMIGIAPVNGTETQTGRTGYTS